MRDPIETAEEFHTMHPARPSEPSTFWHDLLLAVVVVGLIVTIIYLALES